jgi:acyl-CoA synthetase
MKPILTLHDPATAAAYYAAGLWREQSCYRLMSDHAKKRGAAFALRDRGRRLTWDQLKTAVDGFAASLAEGGLRRGDRLSIWASNRVEVVIAFLAASRDGYVCNPSLHVNYTTAEVRHLLDEIQAAAFVYEPGHGADGNRIDAARAVADLDGLNQVIALEPGRQGMALPMSSTDFTPVPSPDKVCYLAFTSGTTGKPKGVMHSDNTLLTNARALVADWHHDADTKLLSLSPLSHHIAWVGLAQALVAGAEFIINDPPPGANALDWLLETGATYVMGVPTHAMDILDDQRRRGLDRLGAVGVFYMAGAPIPPATAEAFLTQGVMPQNIYGMTENSSHQYTLPDDDKDTIVTSCGRAGAGYEIKIFDREDADRPAAPGTVGQIGGRGAALMLG